MEHHGFYKFKLPLEGNLFQDLSKSVEFEDFSKGRKGNHLVHPNEAGIPIVRTTTRFSKPAYCFAPIHHKIITAIKEVVEKDNAFQQANLHFNNALIETYGSQYRKMKYHSDQALDLAADSNIALFSSYKDPLTLQDHQLRKLKIKNKSGDEEVEFLLEHNTVVIFSISTNTQFSHKIILNSQNQPKKGELDNEWLGITFRQSKTFIQFKEELPCFSDGEAFKLANEEEEKEFFQLRGKENRSIDFAYPMLRFTLSKADLLAPKMYGQE